MFFQIMCCSDCEFVKKRSQQQKVSTLNSANAMFAPNYTKANFSDKCYNAKWFEKLLCI